MEGLTDLHSDLYSDNSAPDWLDELQLKPSPPHLRMGLHPLDLVDWLQFDQYSGHELALRRKLLTTMPDAVSFINATGVDAAAEAAKEVSEWLAGQADNPANNQTSTPDDWAGSEKLASSVGSVDSAGLSGLERAALEVTEDLCVMVNRDGGWFLDAAVVCFPSLWALADKAGKNMDAIHVPVTHYEGDLSSKVDSFFDRFAVDRPVWRRNVSLKLTNELFLPIVKAEAPLVAGRVAGDGSPFWIRTERQTLRRLPNTGAILFTIKTQMAPLGCLRRRPDIARSFLEMYASWDAAMDQFKRSGTMSNSALINWLSDVANGSA